MNVMRRIQKVNQRKSAGHFGKCMAIKLAIGFLLLVCSSLAEVPFRYVGSCGESITEHVVHGNLCYVTQGPNLKILDITNRVQPRLIGTVPFSHAIDSLSVNDKVLYVSTRDTTGQCTLHICDLADPQKPRERKGLEIQDESMGNHPEFYGSVLWILCGSYSAEYGVYDNRNPFNPIRYDLHEPAEKIKHGAVTFAVENGELQVTTDQVTTSALVGEPIATQLIDKDSALYSVIDTDEFKGIRVFDVHDPLHPKESCRLTIDAARDFDGKLFGSIAGPRLWVWNSSTHYQELIAVYDLRDPLKPVLDPSIPLSNREEAKNDDPIELGTIANDRLCWELHNIREVQVVDKLSYLLCEHEENQDLVILDHSNPTDIKLVGRFAPPPFIGLNCMALADKTVFLGCSNEILSSIDVSDPTSPTLSSELNLHATPHALAIAGNRLYIAAGVAGLIIVDISNPTKPQIASQLRLGNCLDVVIVGKSAVVVTSGIQVLDISGTETKLLVKDLDIELQADTLRAEGAKVYAFDQRWVKEWTEIIHEGETSEPKNFAVLDLSNPRQPVVQCGKINGDSISIGVDHNILYGSTYFRTGFRDRFREGRIDLYDPTDPATLKLSGSINPPYAPERIFLRGDWLYAAGAKGGLMLFRRTATSK